MRVCLSGSGIKVRLDEKDKEEANKNKRLETFFIDLPETKFELKVCKRVTPGFLEESGFHISYSKKNRKYTARLSEDKFSELTNPEDCVEGGYFVSRSIFDRIDMTYWNN